MVTLICLPAVAIFNTLVLRRISLKAFCAARITGRARSASTPARIDGKRFEHDDVAAQSGVDRAELHADVAAADDQQVFRDLGNLQRFGRGHDARIAEVESVGHGGLGADGDDRLFIADKLLSLGGFDPQRLRVFEMAAAMDDLDVALLRRES